MFLTLRILAVAAAVAVPLMPAIADTPKAVQPTNKDIDLVLCLDVSSSMNGLIDSAKIKLWDLVNEMARLKPTPNLRVSLYSYGHSNYDANKGWVKKDLDLTSDLDDVYKALNALTINGGEEYVGRVTHDALTEQKWTGQDGALKLIFVCGNEAVNQDKQVTLDSVAEKAKKDGVIVNAIYCGPLSNGESRGWSEFAEKCGGRFMNIDQNKAGKQVAVKTEYDDQILKLNEELNKTYVAYGKEGKDRKANQSEQDSNAVKAAPGVAGPGGGAPAAPVAALERAASKAGALYKNSGWDLVDKMKNDKDFDITKIKEDELCDEMKKMKPEERVAYVKKMATERAELQKKIGELAAKRQKKLEEETAKQPLSEADKALDEAVKGVVRDQAKAKGFEVKK